MTKNKLFFGSFLFLSVLTSCYGASGNENNDSVKQETKPNIVIILADQWRQQSAGFSGNTDVQTPNLDKLATNGAIFENAISNNPVCTPYKASLLTGQRSLTNGVFMNDVLLDTNAVTLAKVLGESGYNTALIGKWHLDGQYRLKYTPEGRRQGFQYWQAVNCDHDYNHSVYYLNNDTTKRYWEGYDAIDQTKYAKEYIKQHATGESPFFLLLSWGPPHGPYGEAPEKYKKIYENKPLTLRPNVPDSLTELVTKELRGYYSQIATLDDMVGELVSQLESSGILDNTIIIFTSDHGDLLGSNGQFKKQQPYDESIRVPLIISYKNVISGKARKRYKSIINTIDLMPTILGLSKVNVPASVEGQDFSDRIENGIENLRDSIGLIYCIQPFGQWTRARGGKEYRGIRTTNYTYVRDLKGPWLLFDNLRDPYQMNNLVNNREFEKIKGDLDKLLVEKLRGTKDDFLPGEYYVKKFNYPELDEGGTVPYFYHGKWETTKAF